MENVKLKQWLTARELTLADACRLTGYTITYLSHAAYWGHVAVPPEVQAKIADRLGGEVSDLF